MSLETLSRDSSNHYVSLETIYTALKDWQTIYTASKDWRQNIYMYNCCKGVCFKRAGSWQVGALCTKGGAIAAISLY